VKLGQEMKFTLLPQLCAQAIHGSACLALLILEDFGSDARDKGLWPLVVTSFAGLLSLTVLHFKTPPPKD
jgi:hypothetical protein